MYKKLVSEIEPGEIQELSPLRGQVFHCVTFTCESFTNTASSWGPDIRGACVSSCSVDSMSKRHNQTHKFMPDANPLHLRLFRFLRFVSQGSKYCLESRQRVPFMVVTRVGLMWGRPFSASQPVMGSVVPPNHTRTYKFWLRQLCCQRGLFAGFTSPPSEWGPGLATAGDLASLSLAIVYELRLCCIQKK